MTGDTTGYTFTDADRAPCAVHEAHHDLSDVDGTPVPGAGA
jgi:hypothetical protein